MAGAVNEPGNVDEARAAFFGVVQGELERLYRAALEAGADREDLNRILNERIATLTKQG